MADHDTYEGWAILELMGHRRLAGYVQEVELAGHGMIRLDVPGGACTCLTPEQQLIPGMEHRYECAARHAATQFYSPASLYCLTPTTEATARAVAARAWPQPAQRWELEPPKPVPASVIADDEDEPF